MTYLNITKTITLIAALALSHSSQSKASDEVVTSLLTTVEQQIAGIAWHSIADDMSWGYTVETTLDKGNGQLQQRIQQFRPSAHMSEQWQLIEQQYQPPSPQILDEYNKTMAALSSDKSPVDTAHVEIIDINSLRLKNSSGKFFEFSFSPTLPMFEKKQSDKFAGILYVNRQTGKLASLDIELTQTFSPSLTVKLTQYDLHISFFPGEEVTHVKSIESHKKGKLMFVSSFDEKSTRAFSDFTQNKSL